MTLRGRSVRCLTFSTDSSGAHSDSSALVQFDLYEQLHQSTETIIVMLAKNISAYFYALT